MVCFLSCLFRLGPLVERHTRTFLPMELSSILLAYTSVGRHSDPVVTTVSDTLKTAEQFLILDR